MRYSVYRHDEYTVLSIIITLFNSNNNRSKIFLSVSKLAETVYERHNCVVKILSFVSTSAVTVYKNYGTTVYNETNVTATSHTPE